MDRTLSGYLTALRTPAGAPSRGQVEWVKTDLFESQTQILIDWTENVLRVSGSNAGDAWNIQARQTQEGWALEDASPNVQGGTLLAKLRWAGKQVEGAALGTMPKTSWNIPRKGTSRGMKP